MKSYVPYYRVSTGDQGESGLGLQAQKDFIRNFIKKEGGIILEEYQDIESGSNNIRKGFDEALRLCQQEDAIMVGYDIKRISRGGFRMMADLEDSKINYIAAIHPNESNFSRSINFIVGKEYLEDLSRNTKKALKVIKDKLESGQTHISKSGRVVTKLGSPVPISRKAIESSIRVRKKKALSNPDNVKASAFIIALRDKGKESWYSITKKLNNSGFKTSRGNDFSQVQVKRLYERYVINIKKNN